MRGLRLSWAAGLLVGVFCSFAFGGVAIQTQVDAVWDQAVAGDVAGASVAADQLFAQVVAWAPADDYKAFHQTAFVQRLMSQLAQVGQQRQQVLATYLRDNQAVASALAFLIRDSEEPARIYALFDRLREKRGKLLNRYAELTAAICVVHDEPLTRRVNENRVSAPDPLAIFDFYVQHEKQMFFDIQQMPAALLVFVIDSVSSIAEMQWALAEYAGNRAVGKLFFTIRYDYAHLQDGTTKQVTKKGFHLSNIRRYGGVCADQAHFAVSVGKSIGVPATYTRGRDGDSSHAWVGYLQKVKKRVGWNFDEGRYETYQKVRGNVEDPQTRQLLADSAVSLRGDLIKYGPIAYQIAEAMRAGALVLDAVDDPNTWQTHAVLTGGLAQIRDPGIESQLALVESGLRQCPAYALGWMRVRDLAQNGALAYKHKQRWAEVLMNLCGRNYPDFVLDILTPMVQTVSDVSRQDDLWNKLYKQVRSRKDLAAQVRLEQGHMWANDGNPSRALSCYEFVTKRYANDGPFVVKALEAAEQLLRDKNRAQFVPQLYAETWQRIKRPPKYDTQFIAHGNWVVVGRLYAERLRAAGRHGAAQKVEAKIEKVLKG